MIKRLKKFMVFSVTFFMLSSCFTSITYAAESNKSSDKNVIESSENKSKTDDKDKNEEKVEKKNDGNTLKDKDKDKDEEDKSTEDEDKQSEVEEEEPEEEVMEDGWNIIDGKKFYVVDNEILDKTGWFKESQVDKSLNSEYEYFLDTDHSVVTGWKKISNQWFYFDIEGVMKKGWINDGGNIYYLDKSGEMLKGWNDIKGNKYYFEGSGKRVTGKYYIDNKFYFFNSDGQLETGIYENNGKLYYSDEDGVMTFDSWIEKKNSKYYVKSDGSLAVGNLYLDGKIYNFNEDGSFNEIVNDDESLLYVEFLSVGDADCEFIKLPSGETVLIDTGDVSTTDKVIDFLNNQDLKTELFKRDDKVKEDLEERIEEDSENVKNNKELESEEDSENVKDNKASKSEDDENEKEEIESKSFNNGKGVIDYVILTHPHSDHIGGMIEILKNFNVGQVFVPKNFELIDFSDELDDSEKNKTDKEIMKLDYKIYKNTMKALKKNNVKVTEIVPESYVDSQKILQFKNSNRNFVEECTLSPYNKYASYNNNSAIVYLDYKDLQALFTADMEWNAEIDFVNRNALNGKEVDVLKAPHHGNDSSSSYIFMSYVKPDVAIVSRSEASINKSIAKAINNTYPVCGVNKYETSTEDGVSLYSTKDNWTIVKKEK